MKFYLSSFNRATDGALSKLISKLKDKDMYTKNYKDADYIVAIADRTETFDFIVEQFKENRKIIHLWAGEKSSWATHDDVWRHSMTLMSMMQLCTNWSAKVRVERLCKSVGKTSNVHIIGNIFYDNLEFDDSKVPNEPYDLILYNPPTRFTKKEVLEELKTIKDILDKSNKKYVWIEPNGDMFSGLVSKYVTHFTFPRPQFLSLMKNCDKFITNSSCQYFEGSLLLKPKQIISIGKRNITRESKYSDMKIKNASDNIIKLFEELKNENTVIQDRLDI